MDRDLRPHTLKIVPMLHKEIECTILSSTCGTYFYTILEIDNFVVNQIERLKSLIKKIKER